MDPMTISLILSGLQTAGGLAGMFRKKPKYPAYQGYSPELKARLLNQIKERIGSQTNSTMGTLESGAIRRGFGKSGTMGKIARDVTIAGNQDYTNAVTNLDKEEVGNLNAYNMSKFGYQNQDYQNAGGSASGALGGGLGSLYETLMKMGERGTGGTRERYRKPV